MKIIVLIKEVPDTWGDRKLNLETGIADRGASDAVLDEVDERALEVALEYADAHSDAEVQVLTMAPVSATTSVRRALAMGAASAIHITDDGLGGADLTLTAQALAASIARAGFDLIIAGNVSTDGQGGAIPSMIAEHLGVAQATNLQHLEIADGQVVATRSTEWGTLEVSVPLPAVISVTEKLPEARYPNFKGIMAAKKKPYETVTVADLGIDPDDAAIARSIVLAVAERPARAAGTKIVDEGDAGRQLADFLIENKLA